MIRSEWNICVSTKMRIAVYSRLLMTQTLMFTKLNEKEKMPLMHCTLLYSGIRYSAVCVCALPNIDVTPTTIAIIISGSTSVCASLIVLANALTIEIRAIRNSTVDKMTRPSMI